MWFELLFPNKVIELQEKTKQINVLTEQINDLNLELQNEEAVSKGALLKIKSLIDELTLLKEPTWTPKPIWLDETQEPYKPSILVVERGNSYNVTISPQDIYASSMTLEKVVEDNGWKKLPHDLKLKAIWDFVINRIAYRYDSGESWEHPTITYYRRFGDCEDGTILFLTLCRIARVPADKVYNACGWWNLSGNNVGHSCPIAQMENGLWFIFESTLDSLPSNGNPKLFKGSPYTADWGVANWLYAGKIKGGLQI